MHKDTDVFDGYAAIIISAQYDKTETSKGLQAKFELETSVSYTRLYSGLSTQFKVSPCVCLSNIGVFTVIREKYKITLLITQDFEESL